MQFLVYKFVTCSVNSQNISNICTNVTLVFFIYNLLKLRRVSIYLDYLRELLSTNKADTKHRRIINLLKPKTYFMYH